MDRTSPAEPDEITLLDIAVILAENLRLLLVLPLAAGLLALIIIFLIPPTYTATTRIIPPSPQQGNSGLIAAQLGSLAALVGGAAGIKNPADQYVGLLKSRSINDAIVERFNLKQLYETRYIEDTRKELQERTKVFAGSKDGIISIEIDDHDPKRAAAMANAFVDELRNLSKTLAITEAAQRRLFFEIQLKQTKNSLTKSEVALRGSGVSEASLKAMPQSALEGLARLKAQITAQEIKLAALRTFMTDSNPELKLALQELSALRAELSKAEQNKPSTMTGQGSEYIGKYRDFKYHEALFELMAKQYELARLDEAREGAVIQVLDEAKPPERSSKPKKALITGLAVGSTLLLTVLFAVMKHIWQTTTRRAISLDKISRLRRSFGLR